VVEALAKNEDSFEPLAKFADELKIDALSSHTQAKGKAFLDSITPEE
jgi:hypothetical protein